MKAVLDKRWYETGVKISDEQMKRPEHPTPQPKPRVELFDLSSRQLKELNGRLYFAQSLSCDVAGLVVPKALLETHE